VKALIKPEGKVSTFSGSGVCKHYSGLARNVSTGDISIKNHPRRYKEMKAVYGFCISCIL